MTDGCPFCPESPVDGAALREHLRRVHPDRLRWREDP